MQKKVLIAANFIGFFHFLWDDIDMLNAMGYKIYAIGDNGKNEDYTLKIMAEKNVTFIDAKIDAKSPFTRNNLDYGSIGCFIINHCHAIYKNPSSSRWCNCINCNHWNRKNKSIGLFICSIPCFKWKSDFIDCCLIF